MLRLATWSRPGSCLTLQRCDLLVSTGSCTICCASQVIYGKAGDVAKECESLTFLGEVGPHNMILALHFAL